MWRATIDRSEDAEIKELVRGRSALVMDPIGGIKRAVWIVAQP